MSVCSNSTLAIHEDQFSFTMSRHCHQGHQFPSTVSRLCHQGHHFDWSQEHHHVYLTRKQRKTTRDWQMCSISIYLYRTMCIIYYFYHLEFRDNDLPNKWDVWNNFAFFITIDFITVWKRTMSRAPVQNRQTRELIRDRKTSQWPSCLR